ncbi:MAG: beta-N-acetylhexosaminidase [Opitutaceae bacterium]
MPIDFHTPPLFERRGLMLDISRNRVPTMGCLRQLIDTLAQLHYNELQLYTEHTFAYKNHEAVWADRSPMTAEEIREIDAYCTDRGIDLIANQNSFGHMERWLRHDGYRDLAECPQGFEHPISGWREFGSTLYPDAKSIQFLDTLYTELLPNFRTKVMNVGGDEPWELGKGRSAERVERKGKHRVYIDFMKQVFELAESHGQTAQFWADIILERPDLVPELPKSVIPVIWGYEADSPFHEQCATVAKAGFQNNFYVAPGAGNWNSFGGRLDVAKANIQLAAQAGHKNGAKGLLLTAWGDNGHHQPWATLFPAIIHAAYACHGQSIEDERLGQFIDELFYPNEPVGNGAALCALGKIDALLPQPGPPNSFLHSVLFSSEEKLKDHLTLTSPEKIESVLKRINELDSDEFDPEICLGIDLNRHAAERSLALPHTDELDSLVERFATQWRLRSREGGLAESLAAFNR